MSLKTQDITCPHCGAVLWKDKTVASMGELRRAEFQLVERHQKRGECPQFGERVAPNLPPTDT